MEMGTGTTRDGLLQTSQQFSFKKNFKKPIKNQEKCYLHDASDKKRPPALTLMLKFGSRQRNQDETGRIFIENVTPPHKSE